jgi:hypothetical protein
MNGVLWSVCLRVDESGQRWNRIDQSQPFPTPYRAPMPTVFSRNFLFMEGQLIWQHPHPIDL